MQKLILALFLNSILFASEIVHAHVWSLDQICVGQEASRIGKEHPSLKLSTWAGQDLIVMDQGFCREFYESLQEEAIPKDGGFKIRLYIAHSFTRYFDSDIQFRSSRYSVDIQDYSWAERGSRNFFNPNNWGRDGMSPFQMIDEPSNIFTVSIEKRGHEFFLSAFHPKFLQASGQARQMSGIIDGVLVDRIQAVDERPGLQPLQPGQSGLLTNQFTYGQMNYEVGYGRKVALIRSRIGHLTYVPRVGLGIMVGVNRSVMVGVNDWWALDEFKGSLEVQGLGGSLGNRIEFDSKNDRVGVFYENRLGYYDVKSQFFDGSQHFKLLFLSNSVGLKFKVYSFKKK